MEIWPLGDVARISISGNTTTLFRPSMSGSNSEDCFYHLLASTRYDPFLSSVGWNNDSSGPSPFLLLPYQYERFISAAKIHNWSHVSSALTYPALKDACRNIVSQQLNLERLDDGVFRLRITISKNGVINVTATPLAQSFDKDPTLLSSGPPTHLADPLVKIFIDKEVTCPSIFTQTKTTNRSVYTEAKTRNEDVLSKIAEGIASDVLLYNTEKYITEATIFNVAFWRYSGWITPRASSGCLPGVMRRKLLEEGRITEDEGGILTKESIMAGEWVLLFNGVQGCRLGRVECPLEFK